MFNIMKRLDTKYFVLLLIISFASLSSFAQEKDLLWTKITKEHAIKGKQTFRKSQPEKSAFYEIDLSLLKSKLKTASKSKGSSKLSNTIIKFPNTDGALESFRVKEESIMESGFQAENPNLRSYVGQSIEHPESIIYFSITPQGLHTMTLSGKNGTQFIDPYSSDGKKYLVYNKKDLPDLKGIFKCMTPDDFTAYKDGSSSSKATLNANDGKLRTFRLALASTVEYSTFHINAAGVGAGTDTQKKAAVRDAMIVTMTRVNGIFKRDLSMQMSLVNNDAIIFLVENDGFTNNDANVLIDESQTIINAAIGAANYDIGHTFSTSGGGVAQLSSPCNNSVKARGVTGLNAPVGDAYDIDFVAHEMGHQFGAPHTWNGSAGNCSSGEWSSSNAYEPGSGSTIMGYAGLCSPQNVQSDADSYFHQKSLQMIWDNISTGSSTCANAGATLTGNNAPTAEAGASYTIPISTPYKLTGASTDTETTDTHTFTWEQYDRGFSQGLPLETNSSGPLVRSFEGKSSSIRYIPKLNDLAATGGSTVWEKLASVSRDINFQLTVRDNDTRGGQTATDNMTVTTNESAGPFMVTSQNTSGIGWTIGSSQNITWDVAGTSGSPINTSNVNILLSTDGGLTYPTTLASNVSNSGSFTIVSVPNIPAPRCRIMVEAVGNIFFAINSTNFAIGYIVTDICNEQFSSNANLNIPIDHTQQISNTINVPVDAIVTDVKIKADISHTFIGDLTITLTHPNNSTSTVIWDENCFDADNPYVDFDILFEDGTDPITCASPTVGTYTPDFPLSTFDNLQSLGDWKLSISDGYEGDSGTLNNWYLELCYNTFELDTIIPTIAFSGLKIFPNPNNGTFIVALNNPLSLNISIDVFDIRGRLILTKYFIEEEDVFYEELSLNNVESGLYILHIKDGRKTHTKKIIIE
jgi:subtilisin-like proprotein convertase family protein